MNKVTIAFDVDGTLLDNTKSKPVANERVRSMLIGLAHSKNVHIVVWSGGGEPYARQAAAAIGITPYVDSYAGKGLIDGSGEQYRIKFRPDIKPDICFDDIQDCDLATFNIIVREK